jgi:hypothetical protein
MAPAVPLRRCHLRRRSFRKEPLVKAELRGAGLALRPSWHATCSAMQYEPRKSASGRAASVRGRRRRPLRP